MKKIKYCLIQNGCIRQSENKKKSEKQNIKNWVHVFRGEIKEANEIIPGLKDGDYDFIHLDLNLDNLCLVNTICNKIGDYYRRITRIIISNDYPAEELQRLFPDSGLLLEKFKDVDFIFCTNRESSGYLSKIIMRRVFTMAHPAEISNQESRNHESPEDYRILKESLLTEFFNYTWEWYYNENSIWNKLDLYGCGISVNKALSINRKTSVILGCNTHHDGGLALLKNRSLIHSLEAEKDSKPRHSLYNNLEQDIQWYIDNDLTPDVIGIIGEYSRHKYFGHEASQIEIYERKMGNHNFLFYITTHERAHLFCSYGMSPFKQGRPVYLLVWEGILGNFYKIDENMQIYKYPAVLDFPGIRYSLPYYIAGGSAYYLDLSASGKFMALAAYASHQARQDPQFLKDDCDKIIGLQDIMNFRRYLEGNYPGFENFTFRNAGIEAQVFKDFAWVLQKRLFAIFRDFAVKHLTEGYPLIISGGCGLNCDWNVLWQESSLFSDVFVPPVTDDSGIAIGAAVDARYFFTGNAKIDWNVYAGNMFINDQADLSQFTRFDYNHNVLIDFLLQDKVFAWVDGRCEIGPRALCHRSLIGAPFRKSMLRKLNQIKKRENFRPIAPVCLEEDVNKFFKWNKPSPYMLYFQEVLSADLEAVTHVDGTARVQTITEKHNEKMAGLLKCFKERTGFPVLCNTSLNYKGAGFINKMSDLVRYVIENAVDGIAIGNSIYLYCK